MIRSRMAMAGLCVVAALAMLALFVSSADASGLPSVAAESAENVTETSAMIQAEVNPDGLETFAYVEYGGSFTAPVTVAAGETKSVSFSLTGLQAGKDYHFRVIAFNSQGHVAGATMLFRTLAAPLPHGERPWWHLMTGARPRYLPPPAEVHGKLKDGEGEIFVVASNLGDAGANGEEVPVVVKDKLPKGLKATEVEAVASYRGAGSSETDVGFGKVQCVAKTLGEPETTTCSFEGTHEKNGETVPDVVPPFGQIEVRIKVRVEETASTGEENTVSVAGGGASGVVSISRPITVSSEATPFGLEDYEVTPEEEDGAPDTQAGSHPFQTTFTVGFNQQGQKASSTSGEPEVEPVGLVKDFNAKLPPGLIGNPTAVPRCSLPQFQERTCPPETVVGVAVVRVNEPGVVGLATFTSPVFNLEPSAGEPARFGFLPTKETPAFIDASVRSGEDYGVDGESSNIEQNAGVLRAQVTLWGVPGSAAHDSARGVGCLEVAGGNPVGFTCTPLEEHDPSPFFTLPTSCPGHPLQSEAEADSWEQPGAFVHAMTSEYASMPTLDGCDRLPFEPQIKVTPDGRAGSTPTGLDVDVHVPQESILNGNGLAQSDVKNITVALPEGVVINPAGGDGLQACPEALVGFEGSREFDPASEPGVTSQAYTPRLPGSLGSGETLEPGVNFCADASKIGTAKIKTPLLPEPLEGAVYLAAQEANPFGSLIAVYIVVEDPVAGVLVKLAGQVHVTGTGQLVSTFEDNPQAAFEDAEVHFFGGERAPLATPARCGPYTTTAAFTPWSAEPSDETAVSVDSSSTFDVTSGPNGSPCPGASLPFTPSLTAGTLNNQAGAFTSFSMTISREDGNQYLQAVGLKMPNGLEGMLTGVELCPEPQASQGLCGPGSLIGETTVSVGVGGQPFTVTGGRVYITGPFEGAPFGLSIVNPAKAGPYDLADTQANHPPCDCVLVRARIEVNPATDALTVTSPNSGPYKIPTSLEGIPLQIKHVNVTINRPNFTFNPTSCNKTEITANVFAAEGATQTLSVPFQATNCATLKFTPKLTVTAAGKASKANGESLLFKISYPKNSIGNQTWFNYTKFDIPKQLPARLTTLQQACLANTFETNRAACPPHSIIGHAIVHTPVVPVPLQGPVYFVSYGGAKFPDAVIILEGYGITTELHGETFINNKTGITSATFRNLPDVPFETIEVDIPTGPYSEFGVNLPNKDHYNYCNQKLTLPTAFTAANGTQIHQNTPITITSCPKPKHKTKKHHTNTHNNNKKKHKK